jgi:two-component system chemotaxis response regulator CheY
MGSLAKIGCADFRETLHSVRQRKARLSLPSQGVDVMARILAVDDSAAMRQMVEVTLSSAGHEVLQARDGREALTLAGKNSVDLVIADINMPEMDGIELVRELRALESYKHTPVLVLTTESSAERKMQGREAGATGWLVKPFNPDKLLATVAKVLT